MKAILVNNDKSLSWSDVADPIIKSEEVLVKVHAAALNRADLMQREGDYPPPPGCPEWMGLEVSGEIVEIGEEAKAKSDWKLGDKVCALLGGGGMLSMLQLSTTCSCLFPRTAQWLKQQRSRRHMLQHISNSL